MYIERRNKRMPKPIKIDEHILQTAARLFYQNGIRATGVDKIVAEAGVAKSTLYYHYKTKEDLVLAVLESIFQDWLKRIEEAQKNITDPYDKIHAFFTALVHWIHSDDYYAEITFQALIDLQKEYPKIKAFIRHMSNVTHDHLMGLANELGASRPVELARSLSMLISGLSFRGMISKQNVRLDETEEIVNAFIRAYST